MQDGRSQQRVVLTGAAGALGRATAQYFLEGGARVALIDHNAQHLANAFPGLDQSQHVVLDADVTSTESMATVGAQILNTFGGVDALVHIAGGFTMGDETHALSRGTWDRMMELNAWSFVAVTQPFVPSMLKGAGGSIVAVSAKSAARGAAHTAAYIASKSALQRLVESMAAELGGRGVRVNSIAPSVLDTPANRQAMPAVSPNEWVSTTAAAQTIGFLTSPAALALHGQHLALDA